MKRCEDALLELWEEKMFELIMEIWEGSASLELVFGEKVVTDNGQRAIVIKEKSSCESRNC